MDEIADVSAGNPAPQDPSHFSDEGHPFVRMQDVGRVHVSPNLTETVDRITDAAVRQGGLRLYPKGTLLVPKSGASVNLNHRAMLGRAAYVVSHLATIIPDSQRVDPRYLFHWSMVYDPRKQAQVTSLPSLPLSLIKAALVPVPPLHEQRRIVGLLDRAAEIRRRADAARAKARAIIPALFLDTFGDPATNPKGWPVVELGDVITRITGGKNIEAGNGTSKYRIMKVSAVTSGIFKAHEAKPAPDDHIPAQDHHVRAGDFLFSRANTSELVGAVAIADDVPAGLLLPDKIWRIEWTPTRIEPRYAYSLLRSSEIRRIFAVIGSGTSGSMKNISQAKLVRVPIPLPPLAIQTAFAEQVQHLEALARHLDAAAAKAEAMAAGLSAEIFGSSGTSS
ncbi:restriction endonuclease subunit S [Acidocella facilis]|uniref:restriction endonuclease subunit S n=1 Tax=Acidocella facilis TaxID=525 RepID=UPI001F3C38FB|nr:restriction endonuclease subunit S [Acidocella facilis]